MAYENETVSSDSASLGSNPSSPAPKNPTNTGISGLGQSGQGRPEGEPAPHKSRHRGYVYFLYDSDRDAIKIGHAVDPGLRLSTLQTGNPNKLKFLEVFRGSPSLERTLHRHFRPYRLFGEWFREDEAIWDFLEDVEDLQLGTWTDLIAAGRRAEFAAQGYPWHDLDIPEEAILALI